MTKKLGKLIDDFAKEMKAKLDLKHRNGWSGWDDMAESDIQYLMAEHVTRCLLGENEEIDIANFCAFLWYAKKGKKK